eukprot:scaffold2062_cov58-Phaeocystis_antarctica.AAC.5
MCTHHYSLLTTPRLDGGGIDLRLGVDALRRDARAPLCLGGRRGGLRGGGGLRGEAELLEHPGVAALHGVVDGAHAAHVGELPARARRNQHLHDLRVLVLDRGDEGGAAITALVVDVAPLAQQQGDDGGLPLCGDEEGGGGVLVEAGGLGVRLLPRGHLGIDGGGGGAAGGGAGRGAASGCGQQVVPSAQRLDHEGDDVGGLHAQRLLQYRLECDPSLDLGEVSLQAGLCGLHVGAPRPCAERARRVDRVGRLARVRVRSSSEASIGRRLVRCRYSSGVVPGTVYILSIARAVNAVTTTVVAPNSGRPGEGVIVTRTPRKLSSLPKAHERTPDRGAV